MDELTGFEILQWLPLLSGVIFLLGLVIGSFLNVVIYRLPIMMERDWRTQCAELVPTAAASADGRPPGAADAPFNLVVPRSRCPDCGTMIKAWQNVPLLSYVVLRGRCANCNARISIRYPIVELATGVLSAVVAWRFGLSWELGAALIFTWSLIALSGIDIDHQLLPDSITLPLLWLGLLVSLAHDPQSTFSIPVDPRSSIIGAAAGYLSLWSVFHLFRLLTGKEGMGYGDFK